MKLQGICLRTVRHSDSQSILILWTDLEGRLAVSIPAGPGRSAMRLRALTQPLSLVELEIDLRPNRTVQTLGELRPLHTAMTLSSDPVKNITSVFLADLLETCLRNNEADPLMTRFIIGSVTALDRLNRHEALNFSIYFVLHFARFLGIEPDWSDTGSLFDMREGRFRHSFPLHADYLSEAETHTLRQLGRMTLRNLHCYRFTRAERATIINRLLAYYSIHHRPVSSIPSLTVFSAL